MAKVIHAAPLSVNVEMDGKAPSLVLSGTADHESIGDVVEVVERLAGQHDGCISLDLGEVDQIEPSAMEALAESALLLRERRKRLRLKRASGPVSSLLDVLNLSGLFCIQHERAGECSPAGCQIASEPWETAVFTLPCSIEHGSQVRARVDQVAEAAGFGQASRDDIMLAVGEAVANAVQHGSTPEGGSFTVSCMATSEKLCVTVSDRGPGFCPDDLPTLEEALLLERGRGIHCMNAVMVEVSFLFDGGTAVRMVKYSR